jgi:hypothetical protein
MWTYRVGGTSDASSRAIGESVAAELRRSEQWASLSPDELLRRLRRGLSAYGRSGDESQLSQLRPLYRWAAETSDTADRFEMYLSIRHDVEKGLLRAAALKPFVLFERETAIVSSATADLLLLGRQAADDGLASPKEMVALVAQGTPANPGAVLGALVSLGDRRVHRLLDSARWSLSDAVVNTAARCRVGLPNLAAFEFWLSWLEGLTERGLGASAVYGACVSALHLMVQGMNAEFVTDVAGDVRLRHGRCRGSSPGEVVRPLPVTEIGARFAARLYSLEAREPRPKLISRVLPSYGLQPRAAPVEIATLG